MTYSMPMLRRTLLARLGQEDDVAIERHVAAFEQQHHHQRRRQVVLVVHRAASVDVAAVAIGAEGRVRPLLRIDVDDVGMTQDEQRTLSSRTLDPRNDIGTMCFEREDLDRNPFALRGRLSRSRPRASHRREGRRCPCAPTPESGASVSASTAAQSIGADDWAAGLDAAAHEDQDGKPTSTHDVIVTGNPCARRPRSIGSWPGSVDAAVYFILMTTTLASSIGSAKATRSALIAS